ncbi:4160_t:CDS:2, partial [Cetraspora pellucida]
MPCYADMIVRVKFVKQNVKEDSNMLVVWALGAFPVEREDYNIELTFKIIPGYYEGNKRAKMTVSTSTHVTILSKVEESNK